VSVCCVALSAEPPRTVRVPRSSGRWFAPSIHRTTLHPFRREPQPELRDSGASPPTQLPVSLASPLSCTRHGGAAAGWQPARATSLLSPQRCDVPSPSLIAAPPAPRSQQPPPPAANAPWKRPRPLWVEVEGRQRREAAHCSRVREPPTHALSPAPAPLARGEARSATAAQPPGHALRCAPKSCRACWVRRSCSRRRLTRASPNCCGRIPAAQRNVNPSRAHAVADAGLAESRE
jgi:hypothetical protein